MLRRSRNRWFNHPVDALQLAQHQVELRARLVGLRGGQSRHRDVARVHNGFKRLPFVCHIGLGSLEQVGNEIEPAPQLDIDLRERILECVASADEGVVAEDDGGDQHQDGEDSDDADY